VNTLPAPLLIVTDRHQARRALDEVVRRALAAGARWVWLRDRDLSSLERRQLAFRLAQIVRGAGGRLSIGDDAALAHEAGTGAVHMRDIGGVTHARAMLGPSALIGMSAHVIAEVVGAKDAGADYVALSPIHPSASKPGYGPALGVATIRAASATGMPVIALGGMASDNAAEARANGAAGIAVMGGVMRADDPAAVTRSLLAASDTGIALASI
jgi:thiamine-phosphate pyrophosphorylase